MSAPGGIRTPRPTPQQVHLPPSDPDELFVWERLQKSREESVPISRHRIATLLVRNSRLPFKEALKVVDNYCDDKYPAVPDYLGKEFAIPFLKFFAVVLIILSLSTAAFTLLKFQLSDRAFFYGIVLTLVFAGLAALIYVRSLVGEFSESAD